MARKIIFCMMLLLLVGCATPNVANDVENKRLDVIKHIRDASVLIMSPVGTGTGVVVKHKEKIYVWTAAHVVNPKWISAKPPEIPLPPELKDREDKNVPKDIPIPKILMVLKVAEYHKDRIEYVAAEVRVVAVGDQGRDEDLALLEIKDPVDLFKRSAITFSEKSKPLIGTRLFHIGNHLVPNYPFTLVSGMITNRNGLDDIGTVDVLSFPIRGGASGGGVFLQSNGRCIGILVSRIADFGFTPGLYVPVRKMRIFAKRHKIEYAMPGAF